MLLLRFWLDEACYALDARRILRVEPLTRLRALPRAPQWVAGLRAAAHGTVPVIDLAALLLGRPSRPLISTRIAMVEYRHAHASYRLGLLLERAVETFRADATAFQESGLRTPETPCLGPVLVEPDGVTVQWVSVDALLDERVRVRLFDATESSAALDAPPDAHTDMDRHADTDSRRASAAPPNAGDGPNLGSGALARAAATAGADPDPARPDGGKVKESMPAQGSGLLAHPAASGPGTGASARAPDSDEHRLPPTMPPGGPA